MKEQMAIAMANKELEEDEVFWENLDDESQNRYRELAGIALDALAVSPEMSEAGEHIMETEGYVKHLRPADEAFRAMIRVAKEH